MTMKWKLSVLALCSAMSFASFNAAAGTTADLSVIGTIAPASCEPTLSNGATVNYGSISSSSMTAVAPALNQLGTKKVTLTIACTGQSLIAVKASDNRSDSLVTLDEDTYIANASATGANVTTEGNAYGLGTSNGVNVGAYALAVNISDVTVTDGADETFTADVLTTRTLGTTWTKASHGFFNSQTGSAANHITFGKAGSVTPVAIKTATLPLFVTAAVQAMDSFTGGETVTLDGNTTISIEYL